MKKILCLLLAFVLGTSMVVAAQADTFDLKDSNGYENVLLESNFAGENPLALFEHKGGYVGIAHPTVGPGPVDAVGAENHGTVVRVPTSPAAENTSGQNQDHYMRPSYTKMFSDYSSSKNPTPQLRHKLSQAKLEIDVLLDEHISANIHFVEYDCENVLGRGTRHTSTLTDFAANGTFKMLNGETYSYDKNTWYSFVYYIDHANNSYTAYCNGELVAENCKIHDKGSLAALSLGIRIPPTDVSGGMYVDNLKHSVATPFKREITINREVGGSDFNDDSVAPATFFNGTVLESKTNFQFADLTEQPGHEGHEHVAKGLTYRWDAAKEEYVPDDAYIMTRYSLINPSYTTTNLTGEALAEKRKMMYTVDVYLEDKFSLNVQIVAQNPAINSRTVLNLAQFNTDGTLTFLNNAQTIAYEKETWYSFRIYVDFVNSTYSLCMNGELISEDERLGGEYLYALGVRLQSTGVQTDKPQKYFLVDNMHYYFVNSEYASTFSPTRQGEEDYRVAYILERDVSQKAMMIAATYDGGRLVWVDTCERTLGEEEDTAYMSVGYKKAEGQETYVYLWDSPVGIKPLTEKVPLQ